MNDTVLVTLKKNPGGGTQRLRQDDFDPELHDKVEEPAEMKPISGFGTRASRSED